MATDVTLVQLFGTGVKLHRASEGTLVDRQKFGFPGLNGQFQATLGDAGVRVVFDGILRATGASAALAGAAINTIKNTLLTYKRDGTVLNIISGAAGFATFESVYGITGSGATTPYRRLIVEDFSERGPRSLSPGATFVVSVEFICVFQKVS